MNLWRRLLATYEAGGAGRLIREGLSEFVRKIRHYQSPLVVRWAQRRVLGRKELLETVPEDAVWSYGTTETVTIDTHQDSLPPAFEQFIGEHKVPKPFVCEVSSARLVGRSPIGFDKEGRLILETAENEPAVLTDWLREHVRRHGAYRTWRLLSSFGAGDTSVDGPRFDIVFPLVRHPSTNYYHWLLGYVEKVRALKRYESATGREPTVLVAPNSPEWVRETISLAGIGPSRTAEWTHDAATVDRLVIPSHRSRYENFTFSPDSCRWIRGQFLSNLSEEATERDWSSRVYVSRKDALDRRVANESAVIDLLSEYGFEAYILSELSVPEQVALFAQAECVVGPHGAGLVNMLFGEDLSVVELLRVDDVRHHYFVLARQLGFDYEFALCEKTWSDVVVDVPELRKLVERALDLDGGA